MNKNLKNVIESDKFTKEDVKELAVNTIIDVCFWNKIDWAKLVWERYHKNVNKIKETL